MNIVRDKDSVKRNLNLYILCKNSNNNLVRANMSIKQNLKNWINKYRMINDSINIKNAYIVNVQINFEIVVNPNYNNSEVITNCITSLQNYFKIDKWQINEPIIIKNINLLLSKVEGVQIVKKVIINNLTGESLGYSNFSYDVIAANIDDVIYPSIDPMIFEVKYPDQDIIGKVVPI